MSAERFDVAVVGTGPVGLTAACVAAQAGLRVCLVGPRASGGTGRTAALLAGSVALLESIGAWAALAGSAGALRKLRIVDDTGSLFRPPPVLFDAAEIGLDAFGWNVENAHLTASLGDLAERQAGLSWRRALVDRFETSPEAARLLIAGGETVEAALVVAADGGRSAIRAAAGIRTRERRYEQSAFTTVVDHDRDHEEVSTEFHTRAGPFTLVPLPGRRSSLVWVTTPRHAARLAAADDAALAAAIEKQSHGLLGPVRIDGPRGTVPLVLVGVDRMVGRRLVLAGEAAHVLSPIGAQGLNLGFADIGALRSLIAEARRTGRDLGDAAILAGYGRERMGDVRLRSAAVDGLNRALLADFAPLDALRGIGLGLLGQVGPLRRLAMRAGLPRRIVSPETGSAARRLS